MTAASTPELPVARKMWRTLEPYHGMIYFVPEAPAAYADLGITGRAGYFASRAAPMGRVAAEVVIATFFNFHPALVRRAIPHAWTVAAPDRILDARLAAADSALRRLLGAEVSGVSMQEAADLARSAAQACTPHGRPLYAGHASLAWPSEPHLVLWHSVCLLREFRGDGHVAALTAARLDGCEALVTHAAAGAIGAEALRSSRAWPREEWDAACDRLRTRGLLDQDGSLTTDGRGVRDWVEETTDELASAPWDRLGDEACTRLRQLVRPWSRDIAAGGTFGRPPSSE